MCFRLQRGELDVRHPAIKNNLLRHLVPEELAAIGPELLPANLPKGFVIAAAGGPV
jgi:hypothetical protein